MRQSLNALKLVPFACFFIGVWIHQSYKDYKLSSGLELAFQLFLLLIAIVAFVIFKLKSPKTKRTNAQLVILSASLLTTLVIYFYFFYYSN